MAANLLKSALHNLGVTIVGFSLALLGRKADSVLGVAQFYAIFAVISGWLFVTLGFSIRLSATYLFYQRRMRVISLTTQKQLVTSGPYRVSRNPLYLGGNLFVFLGAALVLGSPSGIVFTGINLLAVEFMIRREEKQLKQESGQEWTQYTHRVRRWL